MGPSVGDLRTIALFSRCSDTELTDLAAQFTLVPEATERALLFDIGDAATALYFVTEGVIVLESPEDEVFRMHPPALLGELGALTGVLRSMKVTVQGGRCYRVDALKWQQFVFERHAFGMRLLRDLLRVAAEKIHRDQVTLGTLRQNAEWTQGELREAMIALQAPADVAVMSARSAIDALITRNRRQRVRVTPSVTMPVTLHLDGAAAPVLELSRTHLSFQVATERSPVAGARLAATLSLSGKTVPISGQVIRASAGRVTLELDALGEELAAPLDGYLSRAQLLDLLL
jgi:CRP/FNR family transcriptional regulator, cyclic AMP receptor protein